MNEDIKLLINSPEIKVVSFDMFDTLVSRPFNTPSDLFSTINEDVNKILGSDFDFKKIRTLSEHNARKRILSGEVNLEEIYAALNEILNIDSQKLSDIMKLETDTEINLCFRRPEGYELFEFAKECGKQIIITTDMYLPLEVIVKILENCGFDGYSKIFLSGQLRRSKADGSMYRYILKNLNIKKSELIHIGDNINSDVNIPKYLKIKACYLPVGEGSELPTQNKNILFPQGSRRRNFLRMLKKYPSILLNR